MKIYGVDTRRLGDVAASALTTCPKLLVAVFRSLVIRVGPGRIKT